jgi:hypothetical protein
MRRCRLILSLVAVLVLPPAGAVAQANPFADLGLPELKIKLTDAGSAYELRLDGVPTKTPAGRYQVSSTNDVREPIGPIDDPQPVELAVTFLQLPEDMTVEDFTALFAGPTPSEDSFAFLYETYLAGGPGALQGETTQGVINLIPGDYAVATYGLAAKAMTVTDGDVASPGAREIAASATIIETGTSGSFAFEVTSLTPGPGVLEIRNDSDQPHLVFGIRSEAPITGDEVLTILMEERARAAARRPRLILRQRC